VIEGLRRSAVEGKTTQQAFQTETSHQITDLKKYVYVWMVLGGGKRIVTDYEQ